MGSGSFGNFIKGIWQLFLNFIGFLFDLDFSEKEPENPFTNVPNPARLNEQNKVFTSDDTELLETAFGEDAADYINQLRNEVDYLVKEHNLKRMQSILTVLPPQKLAEANVPTAVINNVIENIYGQFDGDVILRPGKINVFVNDSGIRFAEMYIDCYKPVEELVKK
ncbi:MAG: hypothetical protein A2039_07265 [Candidatus Melainabacteria bacterium GWA2_34_9]|nr:MAG: hypothetical protein A2039_07265 [Candidatus Melainabacteria bacterium GWA2_34_9]